MDIYFIYAYGCEKCEEMEALLITLKKPRTKIVRMECETEDAIDYAVDNNINDLPACNIGGIIIQGEDFDTDEIKAAIKKMNL